jgi:hypothetical protein
MFQIDVCRGRSIFRTFQASAVSPAIETPRRPDGNPTDTSPGHLPRIEGNPGDLLMLTSIRVLAHKLREHERRRATQRLIGQLDARIRRDIGFDD